MGFWGSGDARGKAILSAPAPRQRAHLPSAPPRPSSFWLRPPAGSLLSSRRVSVPRQRALHPSAPPRPCSLWLRPLVPASLYSEPEGTPSVRPAEALFRLRPPDPSVRPVESSFRGRGRSPSLRPGEALFRLRLPDPSVRPGEALVTLRSSRSLAPSDRGTADRAPRAERDTLQAVAPPAPPPGAWTSPREKHGIGRRRADCTFPPPFIAQIRVPPPPRPPPPPSFVAAKPAGWAQRRQEKAAWRARPLSTNQEFLHPRTLSVPAPPDQSGGSVPRLLAPCRARWGR